MTCGPALVEFLQFVPIVGVRACTTLRRVALVLYRSNRIERLAEELAHVVRAPLSDPFARECIVVQGPGMERWLGGYLSRALGVWANPWFPFPRALLELFVDAVLGAPSEAWKPFDPGPLTWSIARTLPALLDDPAFRDVAAYLEHDRAHERLLDLSQRLADGFDQYVVYRPEQVLAWARGDGSHFQAKLFRTLARASDGRHLATRLRDFDQELARGHALAPHGLPERIALFGISTLPPAFVSVFARIAEQIDVHIYLLTPSREYWGELDRSQRARGDLHGLLAQLGKVSREFLDLLEGAPYHEPRQDLFESPSGDTLLHGLQSDLAELVARGRNDREARGSDLSELAPPRTIASDDDSLRVHVCHSVVRELEVLRDQLRARFERDSTLEPRDVIVFAPDIERYAPAIEAVFGEHDPAARIPFRIADRRTARTSEVAEAFFALLELVCSRLYVSDVFDLLQRECVRERFDIAESELDRLLRWFGQAGARWAIDGEHRASFGQPAFAENTLRFALDRLLVGYAARDGEPRELYDVLPFSEVEGRDAVLLGKLARYLDALFIAVRELATPRPPSLLCATLRALLGALLSDEGELGIEHQALRGALTELEEEAARADFSLPVSLASLRRLLEQRIDRGRANVGFLAGGVTFCEPVPMRAIPFRVVCLLGLDDESFPRTRARPAFDLLAAEPRPGDRTLRDDDRQLFLEAILSARDALHLSYVGRSAQDDSERPASVVVEQLLRICDQHFVLAGADHTLELDFAGSIAQAITFTHALHRFDPRYFQRAGGFFSYDQRALAAARSLLAPKREARAFVTRPLPPASPAPELTLEALSRFFRRPQELFLKERLKVHLPRELDELAEREPLALAALDRYRLGDDLLQQRTKLERGERERLLRKAGRLGPGSLGRAQFEDIEALIDGVVAACPDAATLPDREFKLELEHGTLVGKLGCLSASAHVVQGVGTLHTKRRLTGFIEHLVLCALDDLPRKTLLIGRDKTEVKRITFTFVADARRELDRLLMLHRLGLIMPLPLFHDASEAYAKEWRKSGDERRALAAAQPKLASQGVVRGAADDRHVLQLFSRDALLDLGALSASDGTETLGFGEIARIVFEPLLAHMQQGDE